MKNLIVYKSKHGTTRKVVLELQNRLGKDTTQIADLSKIKKPDITDYSTVIIGGSIHMGEIQKKVVSFCKKNLDELMTKKLGLFLCFMDKEYAQEEFEDSYPKALREHSSANGLFGGEFLIEEMNFLEKMIIKNTSGVTETTSEIDQTAIDTFLEVFKKGGHQLAPNLTKIPHLYR